MTRKIGYLLVPLALLLLMAACQPKYEEPEVTDPTLPSISLDQTPVQQLAAAIEKTEAEEKFDIRYGIKTRVGEETAEDVHSQTVTEDQSFDRDRMWGKAPELAVRQNFLEQFGNQSLRIIPSNTGIIRYELLYLSWEDAEPLLYGDGRDAPLVDAHWTVSLTVDAAGRLSGFEITSEREEETRTVFLSITFPEDP